jgi:hypothetical protein
MDEIPFEEFAVIHHQDQSIRMTANFRREGGFMHRAVSKYASNNDKQAMNSYIQKQRTHTKIDMNVLYSFGVQPPHCLDPLLADGCQHYKHRGVNSVTSPLRYCFCNRSVPNCLHAPPTSLSAACAELLSSPNRIPKY